MTQIDDIFAGSDPFAIARRWLAEAKLTEPTDANAAALATVDCEGMPNNRVVLIKAIEDDGFVFFTNYESAKGQEIAGSQKAAFVIHWKSLARQIRVRGDISRVSPEESDTYYNSRPLQSRIGAWASQQSRPLQSRDALIAETERLGHQHGEDPPRPEHWGGYKITPREIEFWADAEFRLHDRFKWTRNNQNESWNSVRLNP